MTDNVIPFPVPAADCPEPDALPYVAPDPEPAPRPPFACGCGPCFTRADCPAWHEDVA
jgi:hypothetical protein